eukprot:TRINITY_DN3114_c0_g1_i3.p3 TRINITY_DN3114_c0_g1~~TRINITY_DN3114_c0_g1_i3.p3  ORF type:complete len:111 (+),score=13.64 TRINITY_DN3114_c0_g1_i3:166-498(+)
MVAVRERRGISMDKTMLVHVSKCVYHKSCEGEYFLSSLQVNDNELWVKSNKEKWMYRNTSGMWVITSDVNEFSIGSGHVASIGSEWESPIDVVSWQVCCQHIFNTTGGQW